MCCFERFKGLIGPILLAALGAIALSVRLLCVVFPSLLKEVPTWRFAMAGWRVLDAHTQHAHAAGSVRQLSDQWKPADIDFSLLFCVALCVETGR